MRRVGTVYDVLGESRERDTLRARDVGANREREWKRSEFLSRGLLVEVKP